jgi:hypothetical protein
MIMASKTTRVVHPVLEDLVQEVDSSNVKEWTDAGWIRESELSARKQKEIDAAAAAAPVAPKEG